VPEGKWRKKQRNKNWRASRQKIAPSKNRWSSAEQLRLKISEKGGLSVYGLGRFPVTLYKEQWIRLLEQAEEIKEFLKENDQQLKAKQSAPGRPIDNER